MNLRFRPKMNTNTIMTKRDQLITSLFSVPACQRPEGDIDWFPAVDLTETEREYVFEVDLPGLTADEIQLRTDADGLCISGRRASRHPDGKCLRVERPSGAFLRQLPLPPDAQGEILATFGDGVLELRLPKNRGDGEPEQAQVAVEAVP